jgi:hypothetical protein
VKIIFCSRWGTYAAYIMAALHVGIYDPDSMPSHDLIMAQWQLCRLSGECYGILIYVGIDEEYREVYTMGCKESSGMIQRLQTSMSSVFQIKDDLYYIETHNLEGMIPRLLQKLHKYKCIDQICKRLFSVWMEKAFGACVKQVMREKKRIAGESL